MRAAPAHETQRRLVANAGCPGSPSTRRKRTRIELLGRWAIAVQDPGVCPSASAPPPMGDLQHPDASGKEHAAAAHGGFRASEPQASIAHVAPKRERTTPPLSKILVFFQGATRHRSRSPRQHLLLPYINSPTPHFGGGVKGAGRALSRPDSFLFDPRNECVFRGSTPASAISAQRDICSVRPGMPQNPDASEKEYAVGRIPRSIFFFRIAAPLPDVGGGVGRRSCRPPCRRQRRVGATSPTPPNCATLPRPAPQPAIPISAFPPDMNLGAEIRLAEIPCEISYRN